MGNPIRRRLSQREARRHLEAFAGKDAVDWVADATRVYMTTASNAEYYFQKNGKRMATPDTPEGDDPDKYPGGKVPAELYGLLKRPNPYMDYEDLIELMVLDLLLVGNAYWLKFAPGDNGQPQALYRLAPPLVSVESGGERRLIDHYEYRVPGMPDPLVIAPEDVIHFKLPNPHDPLYGAGIIAGGPRALDLELALVDTMAAYYEQGAKLSGVLQSDRSVPEPIVQKIRRQFQSMYAGKHNAYKVAVLERGLTFQPISPNAAEAGFERLAQLGRERVFQMFSLHPALVSGEVARPGMLDEAQQHFDNKVMAPFLGRISRRVSAELTQAWGIDYVIDYKYTMPEADRLNLAQTFGGMPGVKVKEVRAYLNLEPLGDERDDIVLNLPGITTADGGIADRMPGNQGGRPADPNNTAAIDHGVPAGGAAVTKPSAAAAARVRRSGGKAVEELYAITKELKVLRQEFDARQANNPDPATNSKAWNLALHTVEGAVEAVLQEGEQMTKAQRGSLVQAVELDPAWAGLEELDEPAAGDLRSAVTKAVEEGVRRGYSPTQLRVGVAAENFEGVTAIIAGAWA